jgi:hypothetical protein
MNKIRCDALISPDGLYRYWLTREWGDAGAGRLLWVMLNPSTADAMKNDPTILRCIAFARAWGFASLEVVNLYALRSSTPKALDEAADPYGPALRSYVIEALERCRMIVCAWGASERAKEAVPAMEAVLRASGRPLVCLGRSSDGSPKHPLARGEHRVPNDQKPILF